MWPLLLTYLLVLLALTLGYGVRVRVGGEREVEVGGGCVWGEGGRVRVTECEGRVRVRMNVASTGVRVGPHCVLQPSRGYRCNPSVAATTRTVHRFASERFFYVTL